MTDYPAAQPHGPIETLLDDVYWVQGTARMGPGLRINRNMVVLRQDEELTILDPVRLDERTEAELKKLGTVRRAIRLGYFHGLDDRYYVDQLGAELWCQAGSDHYPAPTPDVIMDESTELPITDAELFVFREGNSPECTILLRRDGGVLFTCDSVQHHVGTPMCSLIAKVVLRVMGFMGPMNIGPPWRKMMTPDGSSLRPDFERLLELDFDRALGAHGTVCQSGAKAALRRTVERVFG